MQTVWRQAIETGVRVIGEIGFALDESRGHGEGGAELKICAVVPLHCAKRVRVSVASGFRRTVGTRFLLTLFENWVISGRPFGTWDPQNGQPGDKSPGYYQRSLRDVGEAFGGHPTSPCGLWWTSRRTKNSKS